MNFNSELELHTWDFYFYGLGKIITRLLDLDSREKSGSSSLVADRFRVFDYVPDYVALVFLHLPCLSSPRCLRRVT